MPSAKPTDLQYALAHGPGHKGLFRELNPGPLAPEARIMPLDQTASCNQASNVSRRLAQTQLQLRSPQWIQSSLARFKRPSEKFKTLSSQEGPQFEISMGTSP